MFNVKKKECPKERPVQKSVAKRKRECSAFAIHVPAYDCKERVARDSPDTGAAAPAHRLLDYLRHGLDRRHAGPDPKLFCRKENSRRTLSARVEKLWTQPNACL